MNVVVKWFDVICIGWVVVDFYVQQIGLWLEDVVSFVKYLGGFFGNVVFGIVIQGLKLVMLVCVGDEYNGCFLCEMFNCVGVDIEYLIIDKFCLIVLVMLGIKDQEIFFLIFYCDNCVDMVLMFDDISEEYIVFFWVLVVIGIYLLYVNICVVVLKVLEYVCCYGLCIVLDIDYCLVLWGFILFGDGEICFIEFGLVISQLQEVLYLFDLVVGIEEEFYIVGGSIDILIVLKNVCNVIKVIFVCKCGLMGCVVLEGDILDSWDQVLLQQGVCVEVFNVLGVGDVFMLGLLCGWFNDEGWEQVCCYVNVCGVLVVFCYGCVLVMLIKVEFDDYLQCVELVLCLDVDECFNYLYWVISCC